MSFTHRARRGLATAVATALASGGVIALASPSQAAEQPVTNAQLTWSLSNEQGGGAYFGGCNFLTAGTAGNTGSSRVWTESDGFYKASVGNVKIEKPTASNQYVAPTWSTKCKDKNGTAVSAANTASTTGNRIKLSAGTGTVDPDTGAATISWTGSFTSVFYGGMTYWSATNPVLTVDAAGNGTLTATGSGYGADMVDTSLWSSLTPRQITLAEFTNVNVSADGFEATPKYLGVTVNTGSGTAQTTSGTSWGSFPQTFIDFQKETGQSSYWYSSGGSRDAAKPATPVKVDLDPAPETPVAASSIAAATTRLTYGKGGTLPVTVSSTGGTPTGTVTLTGVGASQTKTLSAGKATFSLPKNLAVKSHTATIRYNGAAGFDASTKAASVAVAKASTGKPTVKVSKKPTSKKAGKATVTVKSSVSGLVPTGKIRVTLTKGKSTKRINATLSKGKRSITLPKLAKGTWKLKVTYYGSSTQGTSTSKTYSVKSSK